MIVLLLAAGCGGGGDASRLGGRITVVSRGERIDVATVAEKGKITAILYFADW